MWPFRPKPIVTNESFSRWIRAGRPPWVWFLERSDDQQEMLAIIGDEYMQDVVLGIGLAVKNPEATEAGMMIEDDEEADETIARKVAAGLVTKILSGRQAPSGPSMGGRGLRQEQREYDRRLKENNGRKLFGRPPDSVEEPQVKFSAPEESGP